MLILILPVASGPSKKQTASTASNLAALYRSSAPQQRTLDPHIERWKGKYRASIKPPIRQETRREMLSEKKHSGQGVNGPKHPQYKPFVNFSSMSHYPEMSSGSNSVASGSGSRLPAALANRIQIFGANEKDGMPII